MQKYMHTVTQKLWKHVKLGFYHLLTGCIYMGIFVTVSFSIPRNEYFLLSFLLESWETMCVCMDMCVCVYFHSFVRQQYPHLEFLQIFFLWESKTDFIM